MIDGIKGEGGGLEGGGGKGRRARWEGGGTGGERRGVTGV